MYPRSLYWKKGKDHLRPQSYSRLILIFCTILKQENFSTKEQWILLGLLNEKNSGQFFFSTKALDPSLGFFEKFGKLNSQDNHYQIFVFWLLVVRQFLNYCSPVSKMRKSSYLLTLKMRSPLHLCLLMKDTAKLLTTYHQKLKKFIVFTLVT